MLSKFIMINKLISDLPLIKWFPIYGNISPRYTVQSLYNTPQYNMEHSHVVVAKFFLPWNFIKEL